MGNSILRTIFASRRRSGLDEQLTQVIQLLDKEDFAGAARLITHDRGNAFPEGFAVMLDTVRDLCVSAADHMRIASELAAAATEHQRDAREIRQRILGQMKAQLGLQTADGSGSVVKVAAAVLGPFDVSVHGKQVLGWGGQKNRSLFQYLLLHPDRPAHREVLMELLWPGHSYTSARNNLNVCIYGVRQALQSRSPGYRFILYRDSCYLLDPKVTWEVDKSKFLSLVNAARAVSAKETKRATELYVKASSLYRGPLFEDDLNCEWFAPERQMLHELYLQALGELGELYLAEHDFGAAADTAQRVLSEDVSRESAHRLLMRCYSLQNQRGLVARQFQFCVEALRREFRLSPTDETVSLFHTLTANQIGPQGPSPKRPALIQLLITSAF